jgi:hypothetical protein
VVSVNTSCKDDDSTATEGNRAEQGSLVLHLGVHYFDNEDCRVPTFLVCLGARVLQFQLFVNELARLDVRVT